jgi:hypothetical protein
MIKLLLDNVFLEIIGASKECEFEIWEKLAFEVEEFGSPYSKIRHLYNRKTKKTYAGLLNYVVDIMEERGEEFEIEDTRIPWQPNADFNLVEFIDEEKTIPFKLRPYQEEIVGKATEREVIQAATGAGKTAMLAACVAKFKVKPVSIFADKLTLCTQLRDEIGKFLGEDVGIVGGGMNEKRDITVYSIQSATEEDVKDSKMILFDECLDGDAVVTMWNDQKFTIREIVERNIRQAVKTYNTHTGEFQTKYIYDYAKIPLANKGKKMVKITIEDENGIEHIIKCTEDHKIWIESEQQYIEAGKLIKDMEVIVNN